MTDDIGCKSIMFRGGATGRVVTCGVCIRMVCPDITHARLDRMIHDYEAILND